MADNAITITLDDVLGPDGLDGAWEGMVRQLAQTAESKLVHTEAGKSFHAACLEAINEAVTTRLAAKINERINAPIQKTDHWGNPIGEPATFDQLIGEAVENAMAAKVDTYGNPKRDGQKTILENALTRIAIEGIDKAVKAEVRKVNAAAKDAVSKQVAKSISETIKA